MLVCMWSLPGHFEGGFTVSRGPPPVLVCTHSCNNPPQPDHNCAGLKFTLHATLRLTWIFPSLYTHHSTVGQFARCSAAWPVAGKYCFRTFTFLTLDLIVCSSHVIHVLWVCHVTKPAHEVMRGGGHLDFEECLFCGWSRGLQSLMRQSKAHMPQFWGDHAVTLLTISWSTTCTHACDSMLLCQEQCSNTSTHPRTHSAQYRSDLKPQRMVTMT